MVPKGLRLFIFTWIVISYINSLGNNYNFEKSSLQINDGFYSRVSNGFVIINKNGITLQRIKSESNYHSYYEVAEKTNETCSIENINIRPKGLKQIFLKEHQNEGKSINYFNKNIKQNTFAIDTLFFSNENATITSKYYFQNNNLKYDYILEAGSNMKHLNMEVNGKFNKLSITNNGKLCIQGNNFSIFENIPIAYQIINGNKKTIEVKYQITGNNSYQLVLSNYDAAFQIIIDPILDFSGFFGGSAADFMLHGDMANDAFGNVYTTGTTLSPNFPTTPGVISTFLSGLHDLVILKLSANGVALSSTYLTGSHEDYGFGIDVSNNEVIVTGVSMSLDYPTSINSYQAVHSTFNASNGDVVITKLNLTLTNIIASTFLGGNADEEGHEIIFTNNGNIAIGGQGKAGMPVTAGCYQPICAGDYDFIAAIFDPNLTNLLGATYIGGPNRDRGYGIGVDALNNIYLNGYIQTGGFPTSAGAYDVSYNGGTSDVVVCKFNPSVNNLLFSTYIGSSGFDQSFCALEVLPNGESIFSGKTGSDNFPLTPGAFNQVNGNTLGDVFVAKLNSAGNNLLFSSVFGGPGLDISYNLNITNAGQIALTGAAVDGFPTTPCCYDSTFNGGAQDVFFSIISSDASNLIYSTYIGGAADDIGKAIYYENQFAYIFGNTASSNFPTANAAFPAYGGAQDIFGLKLDISQSPAQLNFTFDSVCVNTPMNFYSEAGTQSAFWNFGDPLSGINNTSSALNPIHQFSSVGNFTVTLIASNSCATDTITQSVSVGAATTTNSIPDTVVCQNSNLLLTATGGTSYVWNNGINSSNDSVLVNITNDTQFIVFGQTAGCPANADTVNVTIIPSATATIIGDTVVCLGDSLSLTAIGNSNSFQWSGAIVSTNDSITITPITNTTLYLQGTGNVCNSLMDSINIIVPLPPVAAFTTSTALCANTNINFISTSSNAYNYYWNFGDSLTNIYYFSTQVNPTHTYFNTGNYNVSLIVSNLCGADTILQNVNISSGPNAILPNDSTICVGQTLTLVSNGGTLYNWSGAVSSTNDSITISPTTNSLYTLTISNGVCFGLTDTILIAVEYPSNIQIISDNNMFCPGDSVTLYGNGGNNINWNIFGSLVTGNPISLEANSSGMVYASNLNLVCPISIDSFYVNVANKSQANFELNIDSCLNIISLKNNSIGASTYFWQVSDVMQSNLLAPQFEVNQSMEYEILLITNPNSNCADSITQKIFIDNDFGNNFFIPNTFTPNKDGLNDEFIISTKNECKYFKLYIYNRWGSLFFNTEGYEVKWDGKYMGDDVPTGVYVYVLEIGDIEKTGTISLYR